MLKHLLSNETIMQNHFLFIFCLLSMVLFSCKETIPEPDPDFGEDIRKCRQHVIDMSPFDCEYSLKTQFQGDRPTLLPIGFVVTSTGDYAFIDRSGCFGKVDICGLTLANNCIAGSNLQIQGMLEVPDGKFLAYGVNLDFPEDGILWHLDNNGVEESQVSFPGNVLNKIIHASGDTLMTLISKSTACDISMSENRMVIAKMLLSGSIVSETCLSIPLSTPEPTSSDFTHAGIMIQTSDNGYLIMEEWYGHIIKTNSNGTIEWGKLLERGYHSVTESSSGEFLASRPIFSSFGGTIERISATGDLLFWEWSTSVNEQPLYCDIIELSNGDMLLGLYEPYCSAVDIDYDPSAVECVNKLSRFAPDGTRVGSKTLPWWGGSPFTLLPTDDGGFVAFGMDGSHPSLGTHFRITKFSE